MKKVTLLLIVAFEVGTLFGQQQKVAVYVTGGQDAGINKVLGDQLVSAIAKSGKYIAIERTASFLAELGKEQNYQRTGAVDDNELSRLGKQFGVQLVCIAEVNNVFGKKYVSARLIDVESAEVVNTSNTNSNLNTMEELLKVTQMLTKELTGKTAKEQATEIAKANAEKEAGYCIFGNLAISTVKTGEVDWVTANSMSQDATIGGYNDWRLPTIGELTQIYAIRSLVWGREDPWGSGSFYDFSKSSLWSFDACRNGHKIIYSNGSNGCYKKTATARVVLVRTINNHK